MKIGRSLFSFAADEDFRGCFDDDDPNGSLIFSWRFAVVWVVVWVAMSVRQAVVRKVQCEGHKKTRSGKGKGDKKAKSINLSHVDEKVKLNLDGVLPSYPLEGSGASMSTMHISYVQPLPCVQKLPDCAFRFLYVMEVMFLVYLLYTVVCMFSLCRLRMCIIRVFLMYVYVGGWWWEIIYCIIYGANPLRIDIATCLGVSQSI